MSTGQSKQNLKMRQKGFEHPRYSREKLGHKAWEILHLISAYVPEKFGEVENGELNEFLRLL